MGIIYFKLFTTRFELAMLWIPYKRWTDQFLLSLTTSYILFIHLELSNCSFLIHPIQKLCNIYKLALTILPSLYSDQKPLSFVMFSAAGNKVEN